MKLLGTTTREFGWDIAIDSNGNSYVTGETFGNLDGETNAQSGVTDIFVTKYDTNGAKQWTKLLGTTTWDSGLGIAVDSSGNSYITGDTAGDLDGITNAGGNRDIFIAKYDVNGTKQWVKLLGTSSGDSGRGIAVDSSGNSYVTGETSGDLDGNTNAGGNDILIVKYDINGSKQWTKLLGTSSGDEGFDIAVDSSGNSYVTGSTSGDLDGNTNAGSQDIFITKYDTNGNKQWTKLLGSANQDWGENIAVDSNGNSYVTGVTAGDLDGNTNAGMNDIFILKMADPDIVIPAETGIPTLSEWGIILLVVALLLAGLISRKDRRSRMGA